MPWHQCEMCSGEGQVRRTPLPALPPAWGLGWQRPMQDTPLGAESHGSGETEEAQRMTSGTHEHSEEKPPAK